MATKRHLAPLFVVLLSFLLLTCGGGGGGGGGGDSSSTSAPPSVPSVDLTGEWGGIYTRGAFFIAPYSNAPPRPLAYGVAMKLQQNSGGIRGTFSTESTGEGTINGSIFGNTISVTITRNSSCSGSYAGHGIATNDSISFSFSGKDCGGDVYGSGSLSRLDSTTNIGWSGNWWKDNDSGYMTSFLTLSTSDSINYTGKAKFYSINSNSPNSERKIMMADLTGQFGWRKSDTCVSVGEYYLMILNLNNIQGELRDENYSSAQGIFKEYNGTDMVHISWWCFGGWRFGGGWYKRIK